MSSRNIKNKQQKDFLNPEVVSTLNQMNEILTKLTSGASLKYIEHVAYLVTLNAVNKDIEYYYLAVSSSLIIIELSEHIKEIEEHKNSIQKYLKLLHSFITKNTMNCNKNIKPNHSIIVLIQNILNIQKTLVNYLKAESSKIYNYKIQILTKILQMMSETPFTLSLIAMQNLIEKKLTSNIFPNYTSSSAPYLPNYGNDKYTLVLDLDETLVHKHNEQFLIRPGAIEFIQTMKDHFELVIFTAATPMHADYGLKIIDPENHIKLRLCRDKINVHDQDLYKDLSLLGRDLNKVIIVDNLAENFRFQPKNGICIQTWIGDQMDKKLFELASELEKVAKSSKSVQDVIPLLPKFNNN
ncbi:hypothetical protein SteCoe_30396 [Stentor coeruleus]|uniref:Mitochondrial import inner membrane translocase subunit TIM50 n=1 Tax=Stentor coeruleus TaxID=5963 RepID=A0A1R2B412_9CILI|nr:hypothetical protein SteCoe_30420 [Stentor coeruleus]OMJ71405.1 hypothetical protein SteCoe_30396 [Stentor coeruleus]